MMMMMMMMMIKGRGGGRCTTEIAQAETNMSFLLSFDYRHLFFFFFFFFFFAIHAPSGARLHGEVHARRRPEPQHDHPPQRGVQLRLWQSVRHAAVRVCAHYQGQRAHRLCQHVLQQPAGRNLHPVRTRRSNEVEVVVEEEAEEEEEEEEAEKKRKRRRRR